MYSCHFFLISSASFRSIPFLSFIEPIFAWNIPLVSLVFLRRALVFPSLLFSSISLHWSLRKAFLPLLAILWNAAFRWVYLSFSPLSFASFLFSAICQPPQITILLFCIYFSWGLFWSLPPVQCYEPPNLVFQACCISDLILWNCRGREMRGRDGRWEARKSCSQLLHSNKMVWFLRWNRYTDDIIYYMSLCISSWTSEEMNI